MKKTIDTLVEDMLDTLDSKSSFDASVEDTTNLALGIGFQITKALQEHVKVRDPKVLYASEVGDPCLRKLWYKVHHPELGEYLTRQTRLKFLYGDILEEVMLFLARVSGHEVTKEQASVVHEFDDGWQIRGRIDAVIDGEIVDVKSASPYSFTKMVETGLTAETDAFGYSGQLGFYDLHKDQLDVEGVSPAFLVVDKQNGKIGLAYPAPDKRIDVDTLEAIKDAVKDELVVPDRGFSDVSTTNGNHKLGINCSYCPFKTKCWPGLRVFLYSNGPVFLTQVKKVPRNDEITEYYKKTAYSKEGKE